MTKLSRQNFFLVFLRRHSTSDISSASHFSREIQFEIIFLFHFILFCFLSNIYIYIKSSTDRSVSFYHNSESVIDKNNHFVYIRNDCFYQLNCFIVCYRLFLNLINFKIGLSAIFIKLSALNIHTVNYEI